ncbi:thiamine pyrophosphate-binding protein [Micromonospora sp. NPDC000442]|uniref:thiamine pyrophosphate-binding protein n=1 Tax=Micromonospora sp. NPDC000442 TaxID=3364217 RepID=UPI0036A5894D
MPDPSVADAVVGRLLAWRIPRVFGHPEEAVAALVEALDATGGDPEFVPARDAVSAAVMAAGHARFAGGPGVCLAAGAVAAAGLLAGLDAARRAGLPVLAVVAEPGPVPDDEVGVTTRLLAEVCHGVRYAADPVRVPELVDEALRAASRGGGPVGLVLPYRPADDRRRAASPATGFAARLVLDELSTRLPPTATVVVDGTLPMTGLAHLPGAPGDVGVGPTGLSGGGVVGPTGLSGGALPYAVAVKLAAPDQPVVALVADDGMRAHGLAELVNIARRRPAWPDPRLVVLVCNTRSGHARHLDPARPVTDDVPYAGWARLLGLHGVRVDRPELVGAAWDEALNADRPCVLEVVTDALTRGSWNRLTAPTVEVDAQCPLAAPYPT